MRRFRTLRKVTRRAIALVNRIDIAPGPILLIAVSVYSIQLAFIVIPSVHRFRCDDHPGDAGYVLRIAGAVLGEATGLLVDTVTMDRKKHSRFTESFERLCMLYAQAVGRGERLPPLDRKVYDGLLCTWLPEETALIVMYSLPESLTTTERNNLRGDSLSVFKQFPGFAVPYGRLHTPEANFNQIQNVLTAFFVANQTVFPSVDADSLLGKVRDRSSHHFATLAGSPNGRRAIRWWWIGTLLVLGLSLPPLIEPYREALARRRRARRAGYLVGRPSVLALLISTSPATFLRRYDQRISEAERRVRAARKEANEREKARTYAHIREQIFAVSLRAFRDSLTDAETTHKELRAILSAAENQARDIAWRESALRRARTVLDKLRLPVTMNVTPSPPTEEERLLACIEAIDIQTLSPEQQREIPIALAQYEIGRDGRRAAVRLYWLRRAVALLEKTSSPQCQPSSAKPQPIPELKTTTTDERFRTYEDFTEVLAIEPLLPPSLDPAHATSIIVTGLLQPGQRGRASFNERYRRAEFVRQDVQSKLGPLFNQTAYQTALAWLIRERVIVVKRKRTQIAFALEAHDDHSTPDGAPIVRRVVALYSLISRTIHTS